MELSPLDPTMIVSLMVAGGVFALAGLWLMLRPKTDEHSAKIEVFGLKFESSSAGLLVFLIGSVFLALPLFVPKSPTHATLPSPGPAEGAPVPDPLANSGAKTAAPTLPDGDIVLPRRVSGSEVEPNNEISDSMQMPFGATVEGSLADQDEDWWVFAVPDTGVERFTVTFRNRGGGCPQYHLYDALENQIDRVQVCGSQGSATQQLWTEGGTYYLRVLAMGYRTTYQLVTGAMP